MGAPRRAREFPRVGISLSRGPGAPLSTGELVEGAQRLESLGFDGIWMADALGRGYFTADPLVGLAVVAGATRQIELATCILQVPLSHPVDLARRVLTLSLAAPGRVALGVGAGSTPGDFRAVGADFRSRFARLDESLAAMRALWRGESVGGVALDPPPEVAGGPPVLIGSWGGRWVERAAFFFDGWIASGGKSGSTGPDGTYRKAGRQSVEARLGAFRAHGGRRAVLASVVADLDGDAPCGPDDAIHLQCPPEEARCRLRHLAEVGFDDVVLVDANPAADHLDALAALTRP